MDMRLIVLNDNRFLVRVAQMCADMKKPPMGSTMTYVPLVVLIEAAQMHHYNKKYHKK